MRFLGVLLAGVSAFVAVAHYTGHLASLRLPERKRHRLTRRTWLAQAGANVSPLQFLVVSALLGVGALLLCWAVGGSVAVGVVPAIGAAWGPHVWYSHHRKARLGAVVSAWPDGILHLLSAIRSGASTHSALVDLATTGPVPLQEAFRHYEAWARVGNPVSALYSIREELADPVSDKAIAVLIEAYKRGTEKALLILAGMVDDIRADERVSAQIRQAQREPNITGWAAFSMPWAALVLGCATSPDFREFYASSGGRVVLVITAFVSLTQLALTRRLARETAEPRVLGASPSPLIALST